MAVTAEIIFVRILFPLMIGICFFYTSETRVVLFTNLIFISLIFPLLLVINIYYKPLNAYRFKNLIGIIFFFFIFSFGGGICLLKKDTLKYNYFEKYKYNQLKIWINDEPQFENGIFRFTANVTRVYHDQKSYPVIGKLLISVKTNSLNTVAYQYGDELIITANYTPIAPPYNPGEFDFKNWLATKNSYLQAFITQNKVIKTRFNKGNQIIKYALQIRKRQIEVYKRLIKNKEAFAIASTLILGYRADLSNETLSAYSKTGTIHALSVSGMHVGIIYVILNWLLSFMNQKRKLRIVKILIICGLIWFYSLLTGFSPSILRSAIMLTVYILAKSFNKNTNSYNILAFTAFCLLIYNPFLVWDVGFQLSFLAVTGLIYLHPKIYKWLYFKPRWADWLWSSVALSLAAQITTFPFSIYYFHQFPLYFIFSNLFILIPITLLMYLGIIILLFKAYFLAPIFEWIIIFMNGGLKWIANLPFSGINQIWIGKFQLVFLIFALIFCLVGLSLYKKHFILFSALFLFIFQLSLTIQTIIFKNQKKIILFTLQKDYCIAFVKAEMAIIISNLNSNDKNFQFHIQPALDQLHIKKIKCIKWETDLMLTFFKKSNHQINFHGYRILLLDSFFNDKEISNLLTFNSIWIHQNPKNYLNNLRKSVLFKSVILDASNYSKSLKNYMDEANKFQIELYVLKKNKAYLIDLNNLP